jgi:hypothetical protein
MEANLERALSYEDQHNTQNSDTNVFDGTLKQYEDILVRLNMVSHSW